MTDLAKLAAQIQAMPAPERLRLAADVLEAKKNSPELVRAIVEGVLVELTRGSR